jgi:putative ABC transport system permease protein
MIRRLVAGEAAILGAVGAVAGAAVGLAAARPIAAGIARALDVPPAALAVDPLILPVAVAVGLALAVLAAWWPARAATRVDLLEGLARAPAPRPARISVRYAAAVVGLTAGAAGIQGLVIAGLLPPRFAVAGGIALLMAFIAATPLVLPPLARLLAMLVPGRWKTERTLALSQILRQPVRTALTTGVLVVAVTNAVGLGHAIRDSVDDVLAWFDRTMRADWVLIHAGAIARSQPEGAAVAGGAEAAVRALAAVAKLEGIGLAGGRVAGTACLVMARDMPDAEPLPVEPVAADPEAVRGSLARGEAVVGTALARRTGIAAGDEVVVDVLGRSTKLKVAALVVDYMSGGSSLLLRRDAAARLLGMEAADMLLVTATAGGAAGLREPLAAIAADHAMVLQSFVDFRRFVGRIVDGLVGALWTILGLGFVVGGLGVANTVTMNVLEQTRSLGLLRAVGMDGRHVTRMVVIQSLLLGAAGSLIGLVGGMTTAAFIQAASQPLLGHPLRFSFRPGIVAGTLAAAVAVTALAAWLPARRAARLDLLEAISTE